MNVLVTAGNTQTPIDRVRCVTNIFTGRTGARVAVEAHHRGHAVTLLTSHPEVIDGPAPDPARWRVVPYRTYDDLDRLMGELIPSGGFDAVIHAAAVSDYSVAGVYASAAGTALAPGAALADATAGKIKSHHSELWLRLVPTAKLVDKVRADWGFRGVLVKFKLEVGVTEAELLAVAERSRVQSAADAMVANALETRHEWAYLGVRGGRYERLTREELAPRLLAAVEALPRSGGGPGGPWVKRRPETPNARPGAGRSHCCLPPLSPLGRGVGGEGRGRHPLDDITGGS